VLLPDLPKLVSLCAPPEQAKQPKTGSKNAYKKPNPYLENDKDKDRDNAVSFQESQIYFDLSC
jgi:hypothetical protein